MVAAGSAKRALVDLLRTHTFLELSQRSESFRQQVEAQRGKVLTNPEADTLIRLASRL